MKKNLLLSFSCFFIAIGVTKSQNLVPNPGFETQDTCPAVSQIYKAQPWISATNGTPDLYNSTCSTQNLSAHAGIGSSGVYTRNTFANNREYMEAPLTVSLTPGQTYCVSFYVKRANYRYACNKIGAYFSVPSINQSTTSNLSLSPQFNYTNTITSNTSWLNISGSFVAAGGEKFIVIGNFNNDATTDTVVVNSASTSKVCYYAIDDISVTACFVGIEENFLDSKVNVFPNPASDKLSIQVPSSIDVNAITIYNQLGEEVMRVVQPNHSNDTYVFENLKLPSGIYIMNVQTSSGIINKKLMIKN